MQADPSLRQQQSLSFSMQNYNSNLGDYNEQVLGIMQTLGIDRQRTVEVSSACPFTVVFSDYQNASGAVMYIVQWLALMQFHSVVESSLPFWVFTCFVEYTITKS